jgi:tRNA A-37 threonylcarbamoyl transferase component Bud32
VALLDEIQRGLLEETDYVREADNLEFFRNGLSGLDFLTVPCPNRDLSTDRVLTMSYVEGEKLNDFLQRKPSQTLRNLVGARLVESCETQIQWLKAVHADQHPGNYLFQPDGRIGLVDFGCVKRISFDILELRRCYDERTWQESEAAARHFITMVYGKGVPYAKARKILPVLEQFLDVFQPKGRTADIVIGNRDPKLLAKRREIHRQYLKQVLRDGLINTEFAFLARSDMGLHHLLHELGAVVNLSEIFRRVSAARASTPFK